MSYEFVKYPDYTIPERIADGVIHAIGVAGSLVATSIILTLAIPSLPAQSTLSLVIYGLAMVAMFSFSAAYHLIPGPHWKGGLRRLDKAAIFVKIAGTYTPVCLVALPQTWGIPLLSALGACAVAGVVLKLTAFDRSTVVAYVLYPLMGWSAIAVGPALITHLSPVQFALILAGGIAYTVGFPVLIVRRPDPWPRTFGYHEVWHLCTVVAAGLHFAAISTVLA